MSNPERMRYQKNILSYLLCLLTLAADVVCLSAVFGYPRNINPDLRSGADIITHILFLMLVFLTAEKMKVYSTKWAYAGAGLGLFALSKIFIFLLPYNAQGLMDLGVFIANIILMVLIAACLITAAVICIIRANKLKTVPEREEEL